MFGFETGRRGRRPLHCWCGHRAFLRCSHRTQAGVLPRFFKSGRPSGVSGKTGRRGRRRLRLMCSHSTRSAFSPAFCKRRRGQGRVALVAVATAKLSPRHFFLLAFFFVPIMAKKKAAKKFRYLYGYWWQTNPPAPIMMFCPALIFDIFRRGRRPTLLVRTPCA